MTVLILCDELLWHCNNVSEWLLCHNLKFDLIWYDDDPVWKWYIHWAKEITYIDGVYFNESRKWYTSNALSAVVADVMAANKKYHNNQLCTFTKIKSFKSFGIQQVCQESCRVTYGVTWLLSWAIRCCLNWVHFLVGFANVDLQTIFRIKVAVTLVALESFLVSGFSRLFRGSIHWRRRMAFLVQKLCPPPGISSQSWWGLPLLWQGSWAISPGVQGKLEGGANIDGEAECLTLAGQRLAESHALGGQVRVVYTHSRRSHFQLYLNYQFSLDSQEKIHVVHSEHDMYDHVCWYMNGFNKPI